MRELFHQFIGDSINRPRVFSDDAFCLCDAFIECGEFVARF